MITIFPDTLVTGTDKWHIENLINGDFFWFGHPFEGSKSSGFIFTQKPFTTDISNTLIIDLEESAHLDPVTFLTASSIFYCENWDSRASKVASFIKNIVYFKDGKEYFIKKDHVMLGEI